MFIEFTKMHGLGNDFVVINNMNGRIKLNKGQIQFICDRHKGIGADGVILVEPFDEADCFMNYINADGSEAQMCGNGVRCITKFLKDNLPKDKQKDIFKIATRSGVKEIQCFPDGTFSVNMGRPSFSNPDFVGESMEIGGVTLNFVSMGNPFAIALVDDMTKYDFEILGPLIENHKDFPNKINFELVQQINSNEFKVRVWERGCGETLACGTGACALYALSQKLKNADKDITIEFPGGSLYLSLGVDGDIIMRGPAESVFSSMIYVE